MVCGLLPVVVLSPLEMLACIALVSGASLLVLAALLAVVLATRASRMAPVQAGAPPVRLDLWDALRRPYVISLPHRKDRRDRMRDTLPFDPVFVDGVAPCPLPQDGCRAAHIKALLMGVRSGAPAIAVLEDDFELRAELADLRRALARCGQVTFDGLLLARVLIGAGAHDGVHCADDGGDKTNGADAGNRPVDRYRPVRVFDARTTAGYIVTRTAAQRLIHIWSICSTGSHVDVLWASELARHAWWTTPAPLGGQRPGKSDIVGANVDYRRMEHSAIVPARDGHIRG